MGPKLRKQRNMFISIYHKDGDEWGQNTKSFPACECYSTSWMILLAHSLDGGSVTFSSGRKVGSARTSIPHYRVVSCMEGT